MSLREPYVERRGFLYDNRPQDERTGHMDILRNHALRRLLDLVNVASDVRGMASGPRIQAYVKRYSEGKMRYQLRIKSSFGADLH